MHPTHYYITKPVTSPSKLNKVPGVDWSLLQMWLSLRILIATKSTLPLWVYLHNAWFLAQKWCHDLLPHLNKLGTKTKGEIKSLRISPHPIMVFGRSAWQSTYEPWSFVSLPNSQRGQVDLTTSESACAEGIAHTLPRCGVHPLPLPLFLRGARCYQNRQSQPNLGMAGGQSVIWMCPHGCDRGY